MPLAQPLLVRNHEDGVTVLSSDPKGSEFVEWQGSGDPLGGDIQPVPEVIAASVAFSRAVQRGILSIENPEDNPEIAETLEKQNAAWRKRRETAASSASASIEHARNADVISLPCIGPSPRGGDSKCGVEVPVREIHKNDRPPLCDQHKTLEPEFVPTQVQEGGTTTTKWLRASLGARERQQ